MASLKPAVLLALGAALAACKGSEYWSDRLEANPLYQRAKAVRQCPTCANLVPIEFGRSFPVPVRDKSLGHFEVLFYPTSASPSKCTMAAPLFSGQFAPGAPDADRCASLGASPADSLGPCRPSGLSLAKTYQTELRLFESLDRAAALYLKGDAPGPQDRKVLADYVDSFQLLAEPGLLPYYYRQSPDFWEWLRQEAGRAIPKP